MVGRDEYQLDEAGSQTRGRTRKARKEAFETSPGFLVVSFPWRAAFSHIKGFKMLYAVLSQRKAEHDARG